MACGQRDAFSTTTGLHLSRLCAHRYVDSDSAVSAAHANTSLLELTQRMAFLNEDGHYVMLNQDGPGSWCQDNKMQLRPGVPPFEHCAIYV